MFAADNEKGFTLVEAMVATVVLAIGILGVVIMQTRAVGANASASSRTTGTGVAISVMETLKDLPFTDANLTQTHASVALMPADARTAATDAACRQFNAATMAAIPMLANVYRVAGGQVTTIGAGASAGSQSYAIYWAVVDNVLPGLEVPSKTIRVYQTWGTAIGGGTSEITTIKYNNIVL